MTVSQIRRALVPIGVCSVMAALAACASPNTMTRSDAPITWSHETKRVALVMSDIQLVQYSSEAPGEGSFSLRADWTLAAQRFLAKAVAGHFAKSGIGVVTVDELTKSVRPVNQMLTEARRDCEDRTSLMMKELKERLMADYALVICAHDTYTSAGAAISDLFLGTLFTAGLIFVFEGSPTPNGELIASAMLVDLRNGETVWSNSYTANSGGLRTERGAKDVVRRLIGPAPL